ncbi:MAG: CoA transferase [Gammaproteobacteria bacterium]|nr:CoA transferase [Gammaproteobacteria bacterium]MYE50352.1 CoA transferase [Gammaproteobacteria bacterium]
MTELPASKPLAGIRLIDLTHMVAGPYAGMILADLGCDTVKVEPPGRGEGTRRLLEHDARNSVGGMGAYFFTLNRNKRSVAIDLKLPAGLDFFYELVRHADVVLDNFSAGVTARLNIDHERLAAQNPKIITCTVTGFGEDGPRYQRPAFDQIIQGLGGGMSITGEGPGRSVRAGIPIGDLGGGMFAVMGVQAALLARQRTGVGQHVDISMLDVQVSLLNYMATMHLMSGDIPHPIGNGHFVHTPYNTFATADDTITIAVIGDTFWPPFLDVVDIDELRDPAYGTAAERLKVQAHIEGLIAEKLKTRPAAEWLEKLEAARVPSARVNNFAQALSDPQVLHRNMVVELDHPLGGSAKVPGNPLKFSVDDAETFTPPPLIGAHTVAVFEEWAGMSKERIDQGIAAGVLQQGDGA